MSPRAQAPSPVFRLLVVVVFLAAGFASRIAWPHASSRPVFLAKQSADLAIDDLRLQDFQTKGAGTRRLTIELLDTDRSEAVDGLIRITHADTGKRVSLQPYVRRRNNWYSVPLRAPFFVPPGRLRIEAFHGLGTRIARAEVDLTDHKEQSVTLRLERFYDPRTRGLRSGNTHLHLTKMSRERADLYLGLAPRTDGLDVVFLSHVRRLPDEWQYVSNEFTHQDLRRLSGERALLAPGEEYRHNFGRRGEGYGHALFLDLRGLVRPVSIGPGLMREGTDGRTLRTGILEARRRHAKVVWAHGSFGFEDVPNWLAGLLDAQNIFDGSSSGTYEDAFYRYLNLGLRIPFSTGTDWLIRDFSRVLIPLEGRLTARKWLASLAAGRSYITNGTFLELEVDGRSIGETLDLTGTGKIRVVGRALGRNDFGAVELIHNGSVVHSSSSRRTAGTFEAGLDLQLEIDRPGWIALRIATQNRDNEFGRTLFAHTSPIYLRMNGENTFDVETARELIAEIEGDMEIIRSEGIFSDQQEFEGVLRVYQEAIDTLSELVSAATRLAPVR